MNHGSPMPALFVSCIQLRRFRPLSRKVTAMTDDDGIHSAKKGARAGGKCRRGDGMTAISGRYVCARARLFGCACIILREWCHAVTKLRGSQLINELTLVTGDSTCCHGLSLLSRLGRAE